MTLCGAGDEARHRAAVVSPGRRGQSHGPVADRERAHAHSRCGAFAYQLVPEQPPLLPPVTEHERVVVPSEAFVMVNLLPDFDVATTL